MSQDSVIQVKNFVKKYDDIIAVNDINFDVKKGEIFGLLGPNGAGKSTTIKALVGLTPSTYGELKILGMDINKNSLEVKKRIGVQLQSTSLLKKLKVKEILQLFATFYDDPLDPDEVLGQVNLIKEANKYVNKLSGGQQQRVGTALSFISNGEIIFLDEPTIGLDAHTRRNLWQTILDMKESGKTILLTTHYMDEAQYLCDRIAIMDKGKIIALDTPANLISKHCKENTLELVKNSIDNEILKEIKALCGVEEVGEKLMLFTKDISGLLGELFGKISSNNIAFSNMVIRQPDLEDVFIKLTGRNLINENTVSAD